MAGLPRGVGGETRSPELFQHDDADYLVNSLIRQVNPSDLSKRPVHARGFGLLCTFKPNGKLASLTDAAMLANQGHESTGIVRFSSFRNRDWARKPDIRGLAIRLTDTATGEELDLLAMTPPRFIVRRRDDFHALARGGRSEMLRMLLTRRITCTGLVTLARYTGKLPLISHKVRSLGAENYHSVTTFWLVKKDKEGKNYTAVRFRLVGNKSNGRPDNLEAELRERVDNESKPVTLTLEFDIAETDEHTSGMLHDASRTWPRRRITKTIVAGELTLLPPGGHQATDVAKEKAKEDLDKNVEAAAFNPLRLVEGIEASEDEILQARGSSYTASHVRRHEQQ